MTVSTFCYLWWMQLKRNIFPFYTGMKKWKSILLIILIFWVPSLCQPLCLHHLMQLWCDMKGKWYCHITSIETEAGRHDLPGVIQRANRRSMVCQQMSQLLLVYHLSPLLFHEGVSTWEKQQKRTSGCPLVLHSFHNVPIINSKVSQFTWSKLSLP